MRLDRLATLCLFHPWVRATGEGRRSGLPILMYHSISEQGSQGKVSSYFRTDTTPAIFAEQMAWLHEQGYRTIDLTSILNPEYPLGGDGRDPMTETRGSGRSVIITFDDGFRDFHTEAFPILEQHGFTASMFLPTAYIGDRRRTFKGIECLTWAEVAELHRHGIHFGSHTVNHPKLVSLSEDQVTQELAQSKTEIEEHLQTSVDTFAYPYAFPQAQRTFVSALRQLLQRTGYRCCLTTEIGLAGRRSDPFALKRIPVNSFDDAALFGAKLAGAYDWLALPQAITKRLSRRTIRPSWA